MRFAAHLTHPFEDLHHPAHARVVVAQPTAVRIDRQLSAAGAQATVRDELSTLAFLAEPEILERLDDGDRERVVDRRVVDVARRASRFDESARTGPPRPCTV